MLSVKLEKWNIYFFSYQKHIRVYDFDKYLSRSNIFMNIFRKTSAIQFIASIRWSKYVCIYKYTSTEIFMRILYICLLLPWYSTNIFDRSVMLYHVVLYHSSHIHTGIAFPVLITSNRNRSYFYLNFIMNVWYLLSHIFFEFYELKS